MYVQIALLAQLVLIKQTIRTSIGLEFMIETWKASQ